jgi:hypothetical protein
MTGDEGVRFCGKCRKNVYNLAAMSAPEARKLLKEAEGGTACLRLARRTDGTVVTGDCRARLRAARARGLIAFAGVLAVVVIELCAQASGLRSLRSWLRSWHGGGTQEETARVPDSPRDTARRLPILDDERYVLGGATVAAPGSLAATLAETLNEPPAGAPRVIHARTIPPSVAAALKASGGDPVLPRPLRHTRQDIRYNAEICVSEKGRVAGVTAIGPVDARLHGAVARKLKTWTYRPYVAGGEARPFCTFVSFLFKL